MTDDAKIVPDGEYMARALPETVQYGTSKGGDPQIALDLQIEGGEYEGAAMTVTFAFGGRAPEYSIKKLRMLGWATDSLEDLTGVDANAVPVRVFDHTWENKTFKKMEIVWGGDGKIKFEKQMDPRQKKGFAATFAGLAKTIPAARPTGASAGGGDNFPPDYGATGMTGTTDAPGHKY